KEYGLEDMVTFTGQVTMEELVKCYSTSEIAVVPSLYEGFGFPAAEAMSCKLPVVATRGGALPEVVGQDGDAGILVPPGNPGDLAAAIKRLLSDEPLRQKMGEAGRKRIEQNFTWEQAAKKVLKVYEELL
ncbi:MAG: glycosyltransferase family 4 protein, partial [Chloroflexota bacterium]|nr:glycosyltransferase family 4 protein [Chloroflexota bacterium]